VAILNRTIARPTEVEFSRPSVRLGPLLFAIGAIVALIAVVQVVQTSRATTASFKIEELQRQKLDLETTVSQLEIQVAQLSSLARVQQEATRLGLGTPASRETIRVSVPGPSGDSAQIPARFLHSMSAQDKAGEQESSWWDGLLDHLPLR
jgi:cell division protein FtsL